MFKNPSRGLFSRPSGRTVYKAIDLKEDAGNEEEEINQQPNQSGGRPVQFFSTNLHVTILFLLLSISTINCLASPKGDTTITRNITTDHIQKMKVVGNIDLIIIKGNTDSMEIKGPRKLVDGLVLQNDSKSMFISGKTTHLTSPGRIKITLWLRNPNIQQMSCSGGYIQGSNL